MPPPIPESALLTPRPRAVSEDAWPEYEMTSALVFATEDDATPISLLHASPGNPLMVVGQLSPIADADAHRILPGAPSLKRTLVMLEDVSLFSYGEMDDHSVAVWAAGKSGWFKLTPGRAYRTTFAEMQEAVGLLYFVADGYKEERKIRGSGRGRKATLLPPYTVDELAEKYAAEKLEEGGLEAGLDKFDEHREFLIASMVAGKEGLVWKDLGMWEHMMGRFPDVFKTIERNLKAKPSKEKAKKAGKDSATSTSKPKPGRAKKEGSTASSSTATLPSRKKGRPPKQPAEVEVIDLSSSETSEEVKDSLVQAASDESSDHKAKLASRSKTHPSASRRTRHNAVESTPEQSTTTPAKDNEDDSEDEDMQRQNKSSLRPRASKASKGAARGGKSHLRETAAQEGESPSSSPTNLNNPNAAKRKHAPDSTDTRRAHKRRASSSEEEQISDDEGIDIPASPTSLPDNPDPVQEDTWLCALSGCQHKVYMASEPASQKLIREHYALHAYDDDERVRMVKRLAQPSLPVARLMEKVRERARGQGFPDSTVAVSRFDMPVQQQQAVGGAGLEGGVVQRY